MFNKTLFVVLLLGLSLVSDKSYATLSSDEGHVEVAMRLIGHELLLSTGDSTSRVLPVSKDGKEYRIRFDTEFQFEAGVLKAKVDSVMSLTKIASSYRVEMQDCEQRAIIYNYEVQLEEEESLVPCGSRMQPKACYNLVITLLDPPVKPGNETKMGWMNFMLIPVLLVLGLLTYFYRHKRKTQAPSNPDLIQLGQYIFDPRNMVLSLNNTTTELTSKESDLLATLHSAANRTLEREALLNTVWGDEGDYVGRTLDVFISKLRKKLEGDPNVKITNIRGIGYKLILND